MKAAVSVVRSGFTVSLSLDVEPGQTLALLGPNGAGKSTVLQALAGLVDSTGSITVGDRRIDELEPEHRRIGYVFQDYLLFPHLTVLENVAFGASRAIAHEWMDRLGIADLGSRRPPQLSGGQAQRVALARALATSPDLLLLDEPLAALDVSIRDDVRAELASYLRSVEVPTIVVTHSFEDVAALADHVIVIEHGVATQRATVRDLVRDPATPYIERLVRDWGED